MAMNFGKYPVLKIDLADSNDYSLRGCKVRIDAGTFRDGEPFIINAEIRAYSDSCKLTTMQAGACLTNSFTYHDYEEMVEYATAPLIKPDQEVVVAVYDSKKRIPYAAFITKTSKQVSRFCSTPIEFVDADMTSYLVVAGIRPRNNEN